MAQKVPFSAPCFGLVLNHLSSWLSRACLGTSSFFFSFVWKVNETRTMVSFPASGLVYDIR